MKNAPKTLTRTLLLPATVGLLLPAVVTGYTGCKKDEPPPPLPSATATTASAKPLVLQEEDAGEDVSDGDADAKKKLGPYRPASSLKKCCAALQQNAANAPPPTSIYMTQAAAACYAAVAQGKEKGSVLAVVRGALKGAGMPGACR